MPTTDLRETGYVVDARANGLLDVASCSLGETPVVAAIQPDVAFVHVDRATVDGDGWFVQPVADLVTASSAARRTVLVAEQVVEHRVDEWGPCAIPGAVVSAVVERPGAVFPDGAPGRYGRDIAAYQSYAQLKESGDDMTQWRSKVERRSREVSGA
jgi:glutaconate CoA-transferase subunit A